MSGDVFRLRSQQCSVLLNRPAELRSDHRPLPTDPGPGLPGAVLLYPIIIGESLTLRGASFIHGECQESTVLTRIGDWW